MISLLQTAIVLTFARVTNYAIMLVTPLFLVRMLDVTTYGQYREFLLYATILAGLLSLAIKENLSYTIPRRPADAQLAITHTVGLLFLTTVFGSLLLVLGSRWFLMKASFDFLWPLVLYVFFFLNFDVLENYWLAKQQSRFVLIYSTTRLLVRVLMILGATYLFKDLHSILFAIVSLEIVKSFVCIYLLFRLRLLTFGIDRELLKEQLRFIVPLSVAGLLYMVNEKAGHLYISTAMGASALAIYTVGTYQLPITAIVRSAVADTLFPEMVRHAQSGSKDGLRLWKTANLFYCVLVFPIFVVLFVFAEQFIVTLFTASYKDSVIVFRIALVVMIRQCFEMGTPLRAINANKYGFWGNLIAILIHLPLLYLLINAIGIPGAALAWLVSDITVAAYLARQIMITFRINVRDMALWPQLFKLLFCASMAAPVLLLAQMDPGKSLWVAFLASVLYGAIYLALIRLSVIPEFNDLSLKLVAVMKGAIGKRRV